MPQVLVEQDEESLVLAQLQEEMGGVEQGGYFEGAVADLLHIL